MPAPAGPKLFPSWPGKRSRIVQGLEAIDQRLPLTIFGVDSGYGDAFINETLINYCAKRGIEFTRL